MRVQYFKLKTEQNGRTIVDTEETRPNDVAV